MSSIIVLQIICAGEAFFLIHGGDCSGNPSEVCIVIQDQNTRYKIKFGASLKVISSIYIKTFIKILK